MKRAIVIDNQGSAPRGPFFLQLRDVVPAGSKAPANIRFTDVLTTGDFIV